ncbi:MAG: hypothetical protein Q7S66_05760 [bacterium]|nr:hypothetical protein [bacterium]
MTAQLTPIPRVESRALNKNTIEWKIPDKVLVSFMLVDKVGYLVLAKVRVAKKLWWNSSWKTFTKSAPDPVSPVFEALDFLKEYGYTIDHKSIKFGEKIGNPEYFKTPNL